MLEDGDRKGHRPLHFICILTDDTICHFVNEQHADGCQKIVGTKDINKMREEAVSTVRIN
jgi:hypothetical protein